MAEYPLISIIVPAYNSENYLAECLESILEQSYRNIEVIVVNDGSVDATGNIIERYAAHDCRLRSFTQNNKGVSAARNLGLDNVHGQYITFVDADDYITVDFLEIMYILLSQTGADIAISSFTHRPERLGLHAEAFHTFDASGFTADVLFQQTSDTAIWGKLFKASLWKETRFLDMRYEDLEILPRVYMKASLIAYTDAPMYYYRLHDNNFFNTFSPARLDAMKAVSLVEKHICSISTDKHLHMACRSRRLAASFNIFMLTFNRPGFEHVATAAWKDIRTLRWECLKNRRVINKIKLGILASYTGRHTMILLNNMLRLSR